MMGHDGMMQEVADQMVDEVDELEDDGEESQ